MNGKIIKDDKESFFEKSSQNRPVKLNGNDFLQIHDKQFNNHKIQADHMNKGMLGTTTLNPPDFESPDLEYPIF